MTTPTYPQIQYNNWWIFFSYIWYLTFSAILLFYFWSSFDIEYLEIFQVMIYSLIAYSTIAGLLKILNMPKLIIEKNRFLVRGWHKEYVLFEEVQIVETTSLLNGKSELRLVSPKKSFPLYQSCVKDFDLVKSILIGELGIKSSLQSRPKKWNTVRFVLLFSIFFYVTFWYRDSINTLKYYLPLPAIETVEIEGVLSKKIKKYKFNPKGDSQYLSLAEFPYSKFHFTEYSNLKNTIYTAHKDLDIPVGSKVKLKIRKSDVARLKQPALQRKRKWFEFIDEDRFSFYELNFKGKIVLQKCCSQLSKS